MNWLQKTAQYKAMPLPSAVIPEEAALRGGVRGMDVSMTEDSAQKMDTMFPDMTFLGAGAAGIAYDCEPNVVCKLASEWEAAKAAKRIGGGHPGIVTVYSVDKFQESQVKADGTQLPELWVIKMKKCQELTDGERILYAVVPYRPNRAVEHLDENRRINHTISVVNDKIKEYWGDAYKFSSEEIIKMSKSKLELFENLSLSKASSNDAHAKNVGWEDGQLVLFDLG